MPWRASKRAQLAPVQVGVQLDLVDRRHASVSSSSRWRCVGLEVGDADRPDPPVGVQLLERAPGVDVAVAAGIGQWIR